MLIIGGGFAGVTAAQKLERSGIQTTLVDKKDYFEVTYAVLRDIAAPSKTNGNARQLYKDILNGDFIQTSVIELTSNCALLDSGETIHFDKVIIASGSRYPSLPVAKSSDAINLMQRSDELRMYNTRLKKASDVLIIGGGVVGVELAGEIAYAMPKLNVTLAHNSNTLLDNFKSNAQTKATEQLLNLGVTIKFNAQYEEVRDNNGGKIYRDLNSGDSLSADITFVATGTLPNNEFLKKNLSHIINDKGLVNVNEHLEVSGQPNFYAIGDIADVGEGKLGYLAVEQGKYLAKAVAKSMNNQSSKVYKRNPFMALVPTGQKTGVVQLPFGVSTWKHLVNIKLKDLFITKTFKEFSK